MWRISESNQFPLVVIGADQLERIIRIVGDDQRVRVLLEVQLGGVGVVPWCWDLYDVAFQRVPVVQPVGAYAGLVVRCRGRVPQEAVVVGPAVRDMVALCIRSGVRPGRG